MKIQPVSLLNNKGYVNSAALKNMQACSVNQKSNDYGYKSDVFKTPLYASKLNFTGFACPPSRFDLKNITGLNCPCCGNQMVTSAEASKYAAEGKGLRGRELQNYLKKYYPLFRENEKVVADRLIEDAEQNPNLSINELFEIEAANSITALEDNQKAIFTIIRNLANSLPAEQKKEVINAVERAILIIDNSNDEIYFQKKEFLSTIEAIKNKYKNDKTVDILYKTAQTLPSSETNIDALFVKFKRKSENEILHRFFSPSIVTTEHIKPKARGGQNNTENYIPLCGKCNSTRSDLPYADWVELHPEMPANLQKYINKVAEYIKEDKFTRSAKYKTYVDDVIKSIALESAGAIALTNPLADKTEETVIFEEKNPKRNELSMLEQKLEILKERKTYLDNDLFYIQVKKIDTLEEDYIKAKTAEKQRKDALRKAYSANSQEDVINNAIDEYNKAQIKSKTILDRLNDLKRTIDTPENIQDQINRLKRELDVILKLELRIKTEEIRLNQLKDLCSARDENFEQILKLMYENDDIENSPDFNTEDDAEAVESYYALSDKFNALYSISRSEFNQRFGQKSKISPDFILDIAQDALQEELDKLLLNKTVLYIRNNEEIEELQEENKRIDLQTEKIESAESNLETLKIRLQDKTSHMTKQELEDKITALEKQRREAYYKMNNTNIDAEINIVEGQIAALKAEIEEEEKAIAPQTEDTIQDNESN